MLVSLLTLFSDEPKPLAVGPFIGGPLMPRQTRTVQAARAETAAQTAGSAPAAELMQLDAALHDDLIRVRVSRASSHVSNSEQIRALKRSRASRREESRAERLVSSPPAESCAQSLREKRVESAAVVVARKVTSDGNLTLEDV